jgi:hypothetical protein
VVVLPTPPFWLMIAIVFAMGRPLTFTPRAGPFYSLYIAILA